MTAGRDDNLIEIDELARLLDRVASGEAGAPPIRLIDATVERRDLDGRKHYVSGRPAFLERGRIPGAHHLDLVSDFSDTDSSLNFTLPEAPAVAAALAAHGLSRRDHVVVYDSDRGAWAARLWWLLRLHGFGHVSVVRGGVGEWAASGRAIETGPERPTAPVDAEELRRDDSAVASSDDVLAALGAAPAALVVSGLREEEYRGDPTRRSGHIPGAVSIPYPSLLNEGVIDLDRARAALAPVLDDDRPVIAYCGGGVNAAGLAFAMHLLGRDDVAVYDGSLQEWRRSGLPLVQGDLPLPDEPYEQVTWATHPSVETDTAAVRDRHPFLWGVTNVIVANISANIVLAVNGSPAIGGVAESVGASVKHASGLWVNLASLSLHDPEVLVRAAESAAESGVPWVFDPVGHGRGSGPHDRAAERLLAARPAIIRGNASEIVNLSGGRGGGRGTDTTLEASVAIDAARLLSARHGSVVAVSGATDYIVDLERVTAVPGGSERLTRVTGAGCALGAVLAAFAATVPDAHRAAVSASALYAVAAERAHARTQGPASFAAAFVDELAAASDDALLASERTTR